MQQKEQYTFEELCSNLRITMSKFCQMAGITEGTMARIRKGYPARRRTLLNILDTFSKVYGISLNINNVSGFTETEKPIIPISEKVENPPIPSFVGEDTTPKKKAV